MALDYSKWDKLELSDDSDIEGHPNVDKASLIRWKQQDIHAKRQQRQFRENQLRVNIETNADLLERIAALETALAQGTSLKDVEAAVKIARGSSTKLKPALATSPEQPLYDDMVESLVEQVNEEQDAAAALLRHRKMIEGALSDEKKELAGIEFEKKQHITTEDIRDGWNSTVMNKSNASPKPSEPAAPTGPTGPTGPAAPEPKQTTTVTLNSPAPAAGSSAPASSLSADDDDLPPLDPDTLKFGQLPASNLEMSGSFLVAHPHIITTGQKDALIMTAFDAELAGDTARAKNIIHQSLLIQYSAILGGVDGARKFIARIADKKHPARIGFDEEVRTTTEHIQNRCRILQAENEQEQEPVEQIQLHAVDPNTEILVQVPDESSESYHIYEAFPEQVKAAIAAKSLAEINKVLADMPLEDAEQLVGQLSESGVLLVEEKIYDANEWETKRSELEGDSAVSPAAEAPVAPVDEPVSTIDELD